ncbi:MAG: Lrp/AsnC family transcriptional regulator [Candidatus Lokiarchaeota archaeon]|nr:Lrp/AsnC family transcriptional regulator [Candidatus Lokiarchaeota archaeon]
MDEIDFGICMMLVQNSRIPYHDLAELFKMSVNSIHKRIKSMVDLRIIQNFNTKLSFLIFSNPVHIIMFGNSQIENKAGLLQELGKHESIFNVTQASDHLFYIHALLRNHNELDPLVSFIREKGGINDLEVGLVSLAPSPNGPFPSDTTQISKTDNSEERGNLKLPKLDFLIVNALKDNSRKPISDIADEVGASTKTVRRHLDKMIKEYLVEFSIDWYPDKSAVIISIVILKVKTSIKVDKSQLLEEIRKKHSQSVLFSWNLSNLPNLMLVCVWASSMKELQNLEASLMSMNFESVNVTVLVNGLMFPSWRDTYLEEKVREIKED